MSKIEIRTRKKTTYVVLNCIQGQKVYGYMARLLQLIYMNRALNNLRCLTYTKKNESLLQAKTRSCTIVNRWTTFHHCIQLHLKALEQK